MITIAGLGMAGSYLLRRMSLAGMETAAYDPKIKDFYVPCGYATNIRRMRGLLRSAELEADEYLERAADRIIIAGPDGRELWLPSSGLCTIDKNRLESDLIGDMQFSRNRAPPPESNEILIDATGVSRYYLGPAPGDFLMNTLEYLSSTARHDDFYFRYFASGTGYYWEFPMSNGYHIGAGGDSSVTVRESVNWVREPKKIVSRKIRLSPLFDHMFRGNVIGVGESIGTVSPITGEGILPSIEAADLLFNCLKRYDDIEAVKEKYSLEIKRAFSRFPRLYQLLLDTRNGDLRKFRNLSAISAAKEDFGNFGIELKVSRVLRQLAFR